jgi:hypothetical protein
MDRIAHMCEEIHAFAGSAERTGTVVELRGLKTGQRTCTSLTRTESPQLLAPHLRIASLDRSDCPLFSGITVGNILRKIARSLPPSGPVPE